MNVLIVEDETAAYETLEALLKEIDSTIKIVGVTESVDQTIHWLTNNPESDLIFLDIQLSDGISFLIFERLTIEIPIILRQPIMNLPFKLSSKIVLIIY